ncbi:MAG: protein-export membrane protein SecF [Candidatus Levybacteria bacterium RIFCSPHIGHO2_01_FULL_36_15]|nr:MAG: protein-export membrane protein SecF [Candidatus Levybacteria bacterium RIFCSPHIGHO2_01_FULL_36_15]OGH38401.1 MAG: protein-export membrane protein SecF [Candidatus Levybacteria bacterium RIFCSPLOWO2_01_FULL_36_10]
MNIIGKKYYYFLLSGIVIIPGLISLLLFGLFPSIDFTGGSRLEISAAKSLDKNEILQLLRNNGIMAENVQLVDNKTAIIRTVPVDQKTKTKELGILKSKYGEITEKSFETVGPVIGKETESNAMKAVLIASLAITLYIAFAFREVSKPVSSWKFGICAVAALLHDVLVVVGIFSILGHFLSVEVDSLFITALLTVMGFSVHDTIVVFDRIRENLKKNYNLPFDVIVNNSILETFNRSLNTSLTVTLVLLALLLFGGENIHWFIVALLVGIVSGTYSSIFNASPLLVVWYEWDQRRRIKK